MQCHLFCTLEATSITPGIWSHSFLIWHTSISIDLVIYINLTLYIHVKIKLLIQYMRFYMNIIQYIEL